DGKDGKRYFPSASVTDTCVPINAGDDAVTVTPGNTAPCASVTVPVNRPWPICANAGVAMIKASATIPNMRFILIPPVNGLSTRAPDSKFTRRPESCGDHPLL